MSAHRSPVLIDLLPPFASGYELDLAETVVASSSAREREFRAGRACARAALDDLGIVGTVGRRPDRSPSWPVGATGSIAHCAHRAVAVAASRDDAWGFGVDVEDESAVLPDLAPVVLTRRERALLTEDEAGMLASLFSVKEAAYKCWYPLTEVELDFTDIEVSLDGETSAFRAQVVTAGRRHPRHRPTCGRFRRHDGHVYAAAWLTPRPE